MTMLIVGFIFGAVIPSLLWGITYGKLRSLIEVVDDTLTLWWRLGPVSEYPMLDRQIRRLDKVLHDVV